MSDWRPASKLLNCNGRTKEQLGKEYEKGRLPIGGQASLTKDAGWILLSKVSFLRFLINKA